MAKSIVIRVSEETKGKLDSMKQERGYDTIILEGLARLREVAETPKRQEETHAPLEQGAQEGTQEQSPILTTIQVSTDLYSLLCDLRLDSNDSIEKCIHDIIEELSLLKTAAYVASLPPPVKPEIDLNEYRPNPYYTFDDWLDAREDELISLGIPLKRRDKTAAFGNWQYKGYYAPDPPVDERYTY